MKRINLITFGEKYDYLTGATVGFISGLFCYKNYISGINVGTYNINTNESNTIKVMARDFKNSRKNHFASSSKCDSDNVDKSAVINNIDDAKKFIIDCVTSYSFINMDDEAPKLASLFAEFVKNNYDENLSDDDNYLDNVVKIFKYFGEVVMCKKLADMFFKYFKIENVVDDVYSVNFCDNKNLFTDIPPVVCLINILKHQGCNILLFDCYNIIAENKPKMTGVGFNFDKTKTKMSKTARIMRTLLNTFSSPSYGAFGGLFSSMADAVSFVNFCHNIGKSDTPVECKTSISEDGRTITIVDEATGTTFISMRIYNQDEPFCDY